MASGDDASEDWRRYVDWSEDIVLDEDASQMLDALYPEVQI